MLLFLFPYRFVKGQISRQSKILIFIRYGRPRILLKRTGLLVACQPMMRKPRGQLYSWFSAWLSQQLFCFSVSQVHTWWGVVGINRGGWKQRGGERPGSFRRHWENCTNPYRLPSVALPTGFHHFPFTIAGHHFLEQNECITLFPL